MLPHKVGSTTNMNGRPDDRPRLAVPAAVRQRRSLRQPRRHRPGRRPARTPRGPEALEQAIIGKAVDLLSGPGGLASFLRRRQLGARLGGPSLPLDIGYAETIPPGIRNVVILRDRKCRWAGGCDQPAAACEVHHTKHKADGGKTSTGNCVLLCTFHHQIAIHRQGWTLVLNPTAPPPRGTRTRRRCCTATDRPPGQGDIPSRARDEHRMAPPGNRGLRRHPVLLARRSGAGRNRTGRPRRRGRDQP